MAASGFYKFCKFTSIKKIISVRSLFISFASLFMSFFDYGPVINYVHKKLKFLIPRLCEYPTVYFGAYLLSLSIHAYTK